MNFASKRRLLYDSSDEEDEQLSPPTAKLADHETVADSDKMDLTNKESTSNLSLSNKLANLKKNQFISSNSGSEADETHLNSQISAQLNNLDNLSDSSNDSDKNASPVLKSFPTKRRRLWSEESNNDEVTNQPAESTNDYQLSSSSEDEKETASSSKITPSNFYSQNSNKKYVISISRSRFTGPRSSVDIKKMKNGYSAADKSSSSNKKKKHKRLKWLSSYDEDDIDETFQKNNFGFESSDSDDEDGPIISSRMQKKIVDLFQNSSEEELTTISQCSTKKANNLVNLRPFTSWNDLLTKIDNTKLLNRNLVYSSVDLIQERAAICRLMEACSEISTKLQAELDKFQDVDTQSPRKFCKDVVVQEQPNNLTPSLTLKPYQMIGLNWLALMHRNNVNGILADEMGLGKTIQTISFLAYLQNEGISNGPHLIVVPSSTLDNWIREFGIWYPSFSLVIYHGKPDERKSLINWILRDFLSSGLPW